MNDPNLTEAIEVLSEHIDEVARWICAFVCAVAVLILISIPSPQRILKEILKEKNRDKKFSFSRHLLPEEWKARSK